MREEWRGDRVVMVVPTYNERDNLAWIVGRLHAAVPDIDVLVVDDGSPDGSWVALERLCAEHPELGALRLSRNFGKESALAAGLDAARGDAVLVMDADLQHPPELIPQLVEAWRGKGAQIVEAVKQERGHESRAHRAGARLFYRLWSRLSGFELEGATDYKLLDRRVVEEWRRLGESNLFFRGMIAWLGFRRVAIRFSVPERDAGASSFRATELVTLALTALTAFSTLPLRLVTLVGFGSLVLGALLGAQTLWRWLAGEAVSGFTTVILLQLVIGSAVLLGLGVIGEYLGRIYTETKRRPRYVTAERCGVAER